LLLRMSYRHQLISLPLTRMSLRFLSKTEDV
jgi:hypothetical protein